MINCHYLYLAFCNLTTFLLQRSSPYSNNTQLDSDQERAYHFKTQTKNIKLFQAIKGNAKKYQEEINLFRNLVCIIDEFSLTYNNQTLKYKIE